MYPVIYPSYRYATHPGRDREAAGLPVGQRGRGSPACTGTQGNGVYDNDNTDSTQNNKALSVIGWNIQNYPKHSQTNSDLKDIINQLDVDIIAFQEIENNQAFN